MHRGKNHAILAFFILNYFSLHNSLNCLSFCFVDCQNCLNFIIGNIQIYKSTIFSLFKYTSGHLGFFHILTTVNNGTINIGIKGSLISNIYKDILTSDVVLIFWGYLIRHIHGQELLERLGFIFSIAYVIYIFKEYQFENFTVLC